MGGIPLAALSVRPPEQQANPLQQYAQAMQIKSMQGQQQLQQQQVQEGQMSLQDQIGMRKAFSDAGGDFDKTIQLASKYQVSPLAVQKFQQSRVEMQKQLADKNKTEIENLDKQHENLRGAIQPIMDLVGQTSAPEPQGQVPMQSAQNGAPVDPLADKKQELWSKQRARVMQNPQAYGISDPNQVPPQYPGDDDVKLMNASLASGHNLVQERTERTAADARMLTAQGAQGKSGPMAPPVIAQLNKTLQDRYNVLNPGKQLPDQYVLPPNASRQQYDDLDKAMEQVEKATASQNALNASRSDKSGARNDARSDKSYQFNSSQLEKVAAPVDQAITRIGKLQESLAQKNPQADALIAPELLSVMAGGAGSGLRMNEAEISRVIGGRSNWQTLQASLNKWSADPTSAQIPDAQRKQITDLVNAVDAKLKQKQAALDDARNGLLGTDDPGKHRMIVAKARTTMSQIDQGSNQPAQQFKVPDGAPPAPKEDGHTLKMNGQAVAVSKGGQWVAP